MRNPAGVFFLIVSLSIGTTAYAIPTGSWTLNYGGTAPANTVVRLTAAFKDPKVQNLDVEFNISGLTNTAATDKVSNQIPSSVSSKIDPKMPNSIDITGRSSSEIKQIDGGSNTAGIEVALDGNITTKTILPGEAWKAFFGPGIDSPFATVGGNLALTIPGAVPINLFLPAGTTPTDAASALANAMILDGFPDVSLDVVADQVSFLLSPSSTIIDTITEFAFDGANLDLGLQIPTEVPEPYPLALLSLGLLGVAGLHSRRFVDDDRGRHRRKPQTSFGSD